MVVTAVLPGADQNIASVAYLMTAIASSRVPAPSAELSAGQGRLNGLLVVWTPGSGLGIGRGGTR
jgi:hypothetical protein